MIASPPMIIPHAARGWSRNTSRISSGASPENLLWYCRWRIPAEKKSEALVNAWAMIWKITQKMATGVLWQARRAGCPCSRCSRMRSVS